MTNHDVLDMIGDARGTYILEAQRYRESRPRRKPISFRKTWLIAAIIALMLLLVGCVAYVLSLSDLNLSEESQTDQRTGETKVWNILSLQGFVGSGNYQAAKEWYEFRQTDTAPYDDFDRLHDGWLEEYDAYGCWSQEIKDKIDEICARYGLELLGKAYNETNANRLLSNLGIHRITAQVTTADIELSGGVYYPGGTFQLWGKTTLSGPDSLWPYPVEYTFRCAMKNVFDCEYVNIGDIRDYEQWVYTMADGTELLLALSQDRGLILVDKADCFVTVNITNPRVEDLASSQQTMSKAALEAIADTFDFSFQPQSITPEEIALQQEWEDANRQNVRQELEEKYDIDSGRAKNYAELVKYHLENDADPERLGYAFYDIDGNGVEELLIGRDGYCTAVYTEVDGVTARVGEAYEWLYPCENGVLACVMYLSDYYSFCQIDTGNGGSNMKGILTLQYVSAHQGEPEQWRRMIAWNEYESLTEEEFNEIIRSYVRIPVKMLPLTEYPLEEKVARNVSEPSSTNNTYVDMIRMKLTVSPERWYRWKYCLMDLDGNGQEEMIWQEDDREFVYTMSQGRMILLASGKDLTVCEGGILEVIQSHDPSNRTYFYYQVDGRETVLVDYLRYDKAADPENPWFRSTDLSGQDISMVPITEEEFLSRTSQFQPLEVDMTPIEEYPLN